MTGLDEKRLWEGQNDPSQLEHMEPEANTDTDTILPLQPEQTAQEEDDEAVSLPLSARREKQLDRQSILEGQPQHKEYAPPPPPPPRYREIPPDQGFTARALAEGAMMVALGLLFSLLYLYLPVAGFIGQLLAPLPMAVLVLRRGVKVGLAAAVAQLALSAVLFGIAQAALMLVEFGALGLFLGFCFRNKKRPLFTLGFSTMIAAAGMVVALLLASFISGLPLSSMFDQMLEMIESTYSQMAEMAEAQGLTDTMLGGLSAEEYASQMVELATRLTPAFLIVSVMLLSMLTYIISAKVLRRMRYDIPQLPPFSLWRMDWRIAWGVIAGLALEFGGKRFGLVWLETLGGNVLWVFCPVLFICGLSFVIWYIKHSGISLFLRVIIVILLIQFSGFSIYFIMLLAVLESIYNLRSRIATKAARRRGQTEEENEKKKNDRIMR